MQFIVLNRWTNVQAICPDFINLKLFVVRQITVGRYIGPNSPINEVHKVFNMPLKCIFNSMVSWHKEIPESTSTGSLKNSYSMGGEKSAFPSPQGPFLE